MTDTLRQVMTKDIVCVSPQQSIQEAAQLMENYNVGSIPVVENGQLRGIITDRDITIRSTSHGDNTQTPVSEVMSTDIVSGSPDMDVHEAADLMARCQVRRLPVVENNQVVGMVALGDFATQNIYEDEAGEALSDISTPSRPDHK